MQEKSLTIQQVKNLLESIKNLDSSLRDKILLQNNLTDGDFHDLFVAVNELNTLETTYEDVESFAYSAFKEHTFHDRKNLIETFREEHKNAKSKDRK